MRGCQMVTGVSQDIASEGMFGVGTFRLSNSGMQGRNTGSLPLSSWSKLPVLNGDDETNEFKVSTKSFPKR
jgi:hypothetical protein